MTTSMTRTNKKKGFYGWFSLIGVMFVIFVTGGVFVYTYGVFLPVICSDMGWSRGEVSMGLSIGLLTIGLPSPLFGFLVAKFGPRVNLTLGNLVAGLGLAAMYLVQAPWHVYFLYGLAGFGAGIGGYVACSTVANNWFVKKRPLAMGVFTAAAGLGGFSFPPIATLLISSVGWRMAYVVLGAIVIIFVSVIGGIIMVRNKPEDMGQVPDGLLGSPALQGVEHTPITEGGSMQNDWKTGQALRNPVTWLIVVFIGANSLVLGFITGHQVAYIEDKGFSAMVASTIVSLISLFNIIGSLTFGVFALKYGSRRMAMAGLFIMVIALVLQYFAGNLVLIWIFASLIGISIGLLLAVMPTIIGEYYGRINYAQIFGVTIAAQYVLQSLSTTIVGFIYDATSSYTWGFIVLTAASVAGLICAYLAKKPELTRGVIVTK